MAEANIIRGRVARFTKLDALGRPVYGPGSQAVTKGLIQVQWSPNMSESESEPVNNFAGEVCVPAAAPCASILNWTVEIQFCSVDPCIVLLMYPSWIPYYDDFGVIKGYQIVGGLRCDQGFALEVWGVSSPATASTVKCGPGATGAFRYLLTPRLVGSAPGEIVVSAEAATFTFNGTTANPVGWRKGPYLVDIVNGVPSVLREPLVDAAQMLDIQTDVRPPEPTNGCENLPRPVPEPADIIIDADPSAAEEGMCVRLIVDNHGFGPVTVNWGDGTPAEETPDCSVITHCYETAGTYEICVSDKQTPIITTCRSVTVPIETDAPTCRLEADPEDDSCVILHLTMPTHSNGEVEVSWGDDTDKETITLESGQEGNIAHCYNQNGIYQIKAVRKELPIYYCSEAVIIPTQQNPTVTETINGECVTLTIDNHGNGLTVIDWGDGQSSQGPAQDGGTVEHCYGANGTYTITVQSVTNPLARTEIEVEIGGGGDCTLTAEVVPDESDPTGMTAIVQWVTDCSGGALNAEVTADPSDPSGMTALLNWDATGGGGELNADVTADPSDPTGMTAVANWDATPQPTTRTRGQ